MGFKHPHFRPGFEDMYPLMGKIYEHIDRETGNLALGYYDLFTKGAKASSPRSERTKQERKLYKILGHLLYNPWKNFLSPNSTQIHNYQATLGYTSPLKFTFENFIARGIFWLLNRKFKS
jgi:hypothetical protein